MISFKKEFVMRSDFLINHIGYPSRSTWGLREWAWYNYIHNPLARGLYPNNNPCEWPLAFSTGGRVTTLTIYIKKQLETPSRKIQKGEATWNTQKKPSPCEMQEREGTRHDAPPSSVCRPGESWGPINGSNPLYSGGSSRIIIIFSRNKLHFRRT